MYNPDEPDSPFSFEYGEVVCAYPDDGMLWGEIQGFKMDTQLGAHYKINYPDGTHDWVRAADIAPMSNEEAREYVLFKALHQIEGNTELVARTKKMHRDSLIADQKKRTCDLCGTEAKGGDWESSTYEVNEVEVEMRVRLMGGNSYPDGGSEDYLIDLCPTCFKERLIPWLRSEGANIEQREWDW